MYMQKSLAYKIAGSECTSDGKQVVCIKYIAYVALLCISGHEQQT